jgi:hypothetical protein
MRYVCSFPGKLDRRVGFQATLPFASWNRNRLGASPRCIRENPTEVESRHLYSGRPVVVDFKYIGPQYPNGSAGHTLNVCGYLAVENLYILCNPAVGNPGFQLITAADLKNFWSSDHYGAISKGILSRPAFVIDVAALR